MPHFVVPEHIIVGANAMTEAKEYLKTMGKNALVVTGKHVARSSMMKELVKILEESDIRYNVFDGITGEPTEIMIEEGIEVYRKEACDFCIGIGGGSPLDAAKAIAAMITNEGDIADYQGKIIPNQIPPVVAIPTTAGTGSEATQFTIITDSKKDIKMLLKGEVLIPKLAIVDASFTKSTPKTVTAATGLDALTHAIEAFTSKKAFSMTDTLAVSAVKRIMEYLPQAYTDGANEEAREQMAIAALEAGICINNSSVTIVHGMSRPIGALFHVPHGISNAMLLKDCLSFALDGAYERFAILARAIGVVDENLSDPMAAQRLIEAVEKLCVFCEIPSLEEYGIKREDYYSSIDKMAVDAITSGSPANTRKPVSVGDCKNIYRQIFL